RRQEPVADHARACSAQYPARDHRPGDDSIRDRDPGRSRAFLSRPRHAAASTLLGTHAERGADAHVPGAAARHLSGHRHRALGARPQPRGRRVARPPRPAPGAATLIIPLKMALLELDDLTVTLSTARGPAKAVRGVSFALDRGETLGHVGEAGSGKSMTALALLGLVPEGARTSGRLRLEGRELLGLDEAELWRVRGDRIGVVFQEPMTALNPLHSIGRQVAETLMLHRGMSAGASRREAIRLLDRVGIPDAARRVDAYPHQFSGGQRQRVTIAMALACGPDILIADEPTTALDVTIQNQILDLIGELVAESGMAMILISHDLGVIAENVRRMMVMYGGTVVESGPTAEVFARMGHPYTQGLFRARPRLGARKGTRLKTIAGTVPELADLPAGCKFADRCALVIDRSHQELPPAVDVGAGHGVRCIRTDVSMAEAA